MLARLSAFTLAAAGIALAASAPQTYNTAATFYSAPGTTLCRTAFSDSALTVAIASFFFEDGIGCFRKINVTNRANGKSVVVTINDQSKDSRFGVMLTSAAFAKIADPTLGDIPVAWQYV